ncbi:MAG TPA: MltA domain-containing protein [Saprospiraceae bacterium]|nr:MltA domain-containing protein [Saprospiraceae bacterium]HMP12849.1 MltA domain-containing protein [Saprospiraceae bacterium]
MRPPTACLILLLGTIVACQNPAKQSPDVVNAADSTDTELDLIEETLVFRQNGKVANTGVFRALFRHTPLDTFDFPIINTRLVEGLDQQLRLLDKSTTTKHQVGNLTVTEAQLRETIHILRAWQQTKPLFLHQYLDAHQIWGEDRRGNVLFTAYFTPIIKAAKRKSGAYRYPIYSRPRDWEGTMPDRRAIEAGDALDGQGLELAYARNKVDIYYMQLQGSGFLEYASGKKEYLAYDGTNRHPYRSIEKFLMNTDMGATNLSIAGIRRFLQGNPQLTDSVLFQNPSYTFFTPKKYQPSGAGMVPLSAEFSIAVDKRYIPLGSCLLAAFPVYDRKQRRLRHEYRVLLAQDVGGAIRGPGHIDVYMGIGESAQRKASYLKHYGRLWLLLPKTVDYITESN